MGRKQTNIYPSTPFSRRICQLQEEHGYSDEEVIAGVVDDNGNRLITGLQAYKTHKSGRSEPNNLQDMLRGYARFYDVSVDYLLEMTDDQKPEIGKAEKITGLSEATVRQLITLKDKSPELLEMIDAIISAASGENISSLYTRIYKDYKDSQTPIPDILRDMYQSQQDSFAKGLYRFILSTVIDRMAPLFDREMCIEADSNQYERSAPSEQVANMNITVTPMEDNNDK